MEGNALILHWTGSVRNAIQGASLACGAFVTPALWPAHCGILHAESCPLSGVKRTSAIRVPMSAFDPKRTLKARHETAPGSNLETGTASWGQAAFLPREIVRQHLWARG